MLAPFSLRFHDGGVEAGYVLHMSGRLVDSLRGLGLTVLIFEVPYLLNADWSGFKSDAERTIQLTCRFFDLICCLIGIALALAMTLQKRRRLLSPRSVEIVSVSAFMLWMLVGMGTEHYFMDNFLGYRTRDDYCSTWFLLFIDLCVTASHLVLPVRWVLLVPIEIVAVLLYPVALAGIRGRPPPTANTATMAILVFAAAVGKRSLEVRERESFRMVLKERTLRVQGEFLASTRTKSRKRERQNLDSNSLKSAGTGYLFEQSIVSENVASRLAQVAETGRKEGWLLDADEVQLAPHKELGSGSFGRVFTGAYSSISVAVKMSHGHLAVDRLEHRLPSAMAELRVLRRLRHPNVATLYGAIVDTTLSEVALVLELVRGPSLDVFLEGPARQGPERPVGDAEKFVVLMGVANALRYLHSNCNPIVYGDLRPSNVLVQDAPTLRPKLIGFGLSRFLSGESRPIGASVEWMAPEQLQYGARASPAADVFSFGRLLLFILGRVRPHAATERLAADEVEVPSAPEDASAFVRVTWDVSHACFDHCELRPSMGDIVYQINGHLHLLDSEARHALPAGEIEYADNLDAELLPWNRGAILARQVAHEAHRTRRDRSRSRSRSGSRRGGGSPSRSRSISPASHASSQALETVQEGAQLMIVEPQASQEQSAATLVQL